MKHQEKIGKPVIENPEDGTEIELGQPIIEEKFEKESVEATAYVIKEALEEFYQRRLNHEEQAAAMIQNIFDPMRLYAESLKEIKKDYGDVTLPLAILEAARGEIQYDYDTLSLREIEAVENKETGEIETAGEKRQTDFEKEIHYQEASEILFSHAGYETPTRNDLLEYLSETKNHIRSLAKEEEKKYGSALENEKSSRIFRSRLLTDIPAIERYETGRHTTGDYREIMGVIGTSILGYRDRIGTLLLYYADYPRENYLMETREVLKEIRKMEIFLSRLEGERNERIAKRQP